MREECEKKGYVCAPACLYLWLHSCVCARADSTHLTVCICSCARDEACPQARPCVDAVFWCTRAYEYEPLAVIHREDMLTGLATSERIGKKPPGALRACVHVYVCVCDRAHTPSCVYLCVCV